MYFGFIAFAAVKPKRSRLLTLSAREGRPEGRVRLLVTLLRAAGVPDRALARLTCPIGVGGVTGKRPAEIAVAVAAQLLQVRDGQRAAVEPQPIRLVREA